MALFNSHENDVMSDINMTPLIDVMLVLLIVFMVTLPVLHHAVKLDLPRATSAPMPEQRTSIEVDIGPTGTVSWNGTAVDGTQLGEKLTTAAAQTTQPTLQLYADRNVRYEAVADVLAAAQHAGLNQINFVTQPRP